ncbi:MAG: autotransporter-associated beta strand repeat-containing protein [Verrucomicrobiota bacterium]
MSGNFFTINNTSGTPLGVGTYRLIQQASGSVSVSGGPFAVVIGAGLAAGTIGDIQVSGGNVNLVVSSHVSANLSWQGGNPDNVWDSLSTANWNNGVGFAQFGSGDSVTFNATGSANPIVNLTGTMLPSSVRVDTAANDYTFTGVGQIAGPTALTKVSAGVLTLQTANAYLGGTTISNGTVRVGVAEAIPSVGSGNVAIYGSSTLDLNGFNNTVNGLSGNGSVDVAAGGNSILTVGNNDSSGSFSGVLKNTSGTLALVKLGTGSQTLSAANTLAGGVTLSAGTLVAANPNALGTNITTVNGGTLNVPNDLFIGGLAGGGGTVANNTTATTNTIVINGGAETTFTGSIVNGSGGGGLAVKLLSGSLIFAANNTYSGGTIVGGGATFRIGNAPAAVGGPLIASNTAHLYLSGGSANPGTPTSVTTVDGAKVIFNSIAEGNIWAGQFNGGSTATNRFIGPVSASGALSFSNFLGVVEFANTNSNSNFRFFNGTGISGGENTLFVFERCNVHTRDSQTVRLGAIAGGSSIAGIGDQAGTVSWEIGAKNLSANFHGYISGVNNSLVKVGSGNLTLDGVGYSTNTVTLPDPFEPTNIVSYTLSSKLINYSGTTTVSNGVLKVIAPNNLTNSAAITLAGGTLDATQIGYAQNQTTLDYNNEEQVTNTLIVTTATVQIYTNQALNGFGSILGSVNANQYSTVNVGLAGNVGTLAVSGSVALNGTVNMELNRSNLAQNCDRLTAASFSGAGAVLNVTNVGPTLLSGTTFQLFNGPISAFTTVNLPATDASGQIAYTWQNNLTVNGSITLVSGLNPNPAPLSSTLTGSTLNLNWPLDHLGWTLQVQTNTLAVGISTNWTAVAGSTATNQVFVPVVPGNPSVFYRLTLPLP